MDFMQVAKEQSARETALDMLHRGKLADIDAVNVEVIRLMGTRVIRGKIPGQIRKALNAAVKAGYIGHLRKDGLKPEVFFHPNSKQNAIGTRNQIARDAVQSISKICC